MFDFADKALLLKEIKKPQDLAESEILRSEPSPLYLESCSDESLKIQQSSDAIYRMPKSNKKHVKNVWDADIKHSGPGYFDQNGNFILDKPRKNSVSWIIKRNDKIEGPFTDREIVELGRKEEWVNNTLIKRDFDKGFVPFKELLSAVSNISNSKDLNKYFSQNQVIEEGAKSDDFFEASITNEKNSRLSNFIRNHEISASVDFIIKTIKDMKKSQAVEAIQDITGLDKTVNASLIDLITESAGYQILSDVDKDGFCIHNDNRRRKGHY